MTQQYVGTKIVTAWEAEKEGSPGYGVKYSDGYISWSPKDMFEEAYLPLGHIELLPPFAQRLIAEAEQLYDRHTKLSAFMCSPAFTALDGEAQKLLQQQEHWMSGYLAVLNRRIDSMKATTHV